MRNFQPKNNCLNADIDGNRHRNKNISQIIALKGTTKSEKAALVMEDDYRPLRNQESFSQN